MNLVQLAKQIDFPSAAIVFGPAIIICGFTMLASRFYASSYEIHEHVKKIALRDNAWDAILREIKVSTEKIDSLDKHIVDNDLDAHAILQKQDEILKQQKNLFAAVQDKKLSELHVEKRFRSFTGEQSLAH